MSTETTPDTSRSRESDVVRAEVRAWLEQNWDPDLELGAWWERLAESGWAVPAWPTEWFGRALSRDLAALVSDEIRQFGAVGPPAGLGLLLAGPTIIAHGSQEQKERYVRPIVTGQEAWCQLFSEPGAGSDLASLQTRATRDGDEFVVNGQKVWTSGGMIADLGMLMARTDPEVPKHKGISYFAFPMNQPGVEVRALREMTGHALFSEVFIDNGRVQRDALIGAEGNGWKVGLTTLMFERAGLGAGGGSAASSNVFPGQKGGMLEKRVGDMAPKQSGGGSSVVGMVSRGAPLIIELAKEMNRSDDPLVRQRLAELYSMNEIGRFTVMRAKAAAKAGRPPGPEANAMKLMMSRQIRLVRDLGLSLLGAGGAVTGEDAWRGGLMQELALFSPAPSIYGGTDEIQKNIIGERVLGLPGEPRTDKDAPFRDLEVGTRAR